MKVLYDHQIFTLQEYGGISRYFYELIVRGMKDSNVDVAMGLTYSNNSLLHDTHFPGLKHFFPRHQFKGRGRLLTLLNTMKSKQTVQRGDYDLLHPTYYDPYFLQKLPQGKKLVVTFHDMIHEKFGHEYKELTGSNAIFEQKKQLLERADKIISVSQLTKNDIMDIFQVDGKKIEVIHLANAFDISGAGAAPLVKVPYLLFVGNRTIYKNFLFFLKAMAPLLEQYKDLHIVCLGGGAFSEDEKQLIQSLKLTDKVVFQRFKDDIAANLYKYATAFIFPSLYEGFGLPVLEAFQSGCPTLLSNGGSLPEVGGDAALYFDPKNGEEMRTQVQRVIEDSALRQELSRKGQEREKLFSWDTTYRKTVELYRSVL